MLSRRINKISILSLLLIITVIFSGCSVKSDASEGNAPKKQVQVQKIARQNQVTTDLVVSGTVIPKEYSLIRSLTPGTIEYLAPVGSQVYLGQPGGYPFL
ncbi:MAG: hypothetical protein COV55_04415 [Candidatus Komeilibacteria bacterium CG11_big_fil_rev_8_21_14_0_20_36_20]|uniref:Uncharacterized protein n=1 Tax=Candidatus Komeilibacteria bacterium CG11_big_fil_rev_8_21_14_0_20_36_20 TaxID=1974477 RepID=A0A2H0NBT0_9BACT|nr:hypothetical protein [Candidatus Falkowbacteria bacterium]PIR06343.1 MAG: hypothetical protein COV55_04415 [Candidatus Komeilibacteria bacterium CG11_big_fil_rev_8_21_14_0_20_36_20]PIR81484.1 MAG: hypothetical protein COU21_03645 [Candidatus Komeilibacteria bacterium CG10_big_fil_rev_8_21_14_0_10_36_65]PJC55685.1 MAG: hypothetical protein CO027_01000 [Candidatus Komeilibacteria bacterium CG_4_9_14_0_2_um_filter_36_13]